MLVRGKEIPPPIHSGLAMLSLLESMEWKHLPNAGGMYDQHPDFVEKVKYYMGQRYQAEKEKQDRKNPRPRMSRAGQGLGRN